MKKLQNFEIGIFAMEEKEKSLGKNSLLINVFKYYYDLRIFDIITCIFLLNLF